MVNSLTTAAKHECSFQDFRVW